MDRHCCHIAPALVSGKLYMTAYLVFLLITQAD
jgi:hypothetical protein